MGCTVLLIHWGFTHIIQVYYIDMSQYSRISVFPFWSAIVSVGLSLWVFLGPGYLLMRLDYNDFPCKRLHC